METKKSKKKYPKKLSTIVKNRLLIVISAAYGTALAGISLIQSGIQKKYSFLLTDQNLKDVMSNMNVHFFLLNYLMVTIYAEHP